MAISTLESGGRVLWCLRRKSSDVRCVIFDGVAPVQVHVLQERDLVLSEAFATEDAAFLWAREYQNRLKGQGWREVSGDCSPSSAA